MWCANCRAVSELIENWAQMRERPSVTRFAQWRRTHVCAPAKGLRRDPLFLCLAAPPPN